MHVRMYVCMHVSMTMYVCTHVQQSSQFPAIRFLLSEDGVFEVEVRLGGVRDEELTAVRIGSVVSHGYHPAHLVLSVAERPSMHNMVNESAS